LSQIALESMSHDGVWYYSSSLTGGLDGADKRIEFIVAVATACDVIVEGGKQVTVTVLDWGVVS